MKKKFLYSLKVLKKNLKKKKKLDIISGGSGSGKTRCWLELNPQLNPKSK